MALYHINNYGKRAVEWELSFCDHDNMPSLAEIVEAAQKEFPDVPLENLRVISTPGAESVILEQKS